MNVLVLMGETNKESWVIRVTSNLDVNKINADFGTTFGECGWGESLQSWGNAEHIYSLHCDTLSD